MTVSASRNADIAAADRQKSNDNSSFERTRTTSFVKV
jgi:hypothetical protein